MLIAFAGFSCVFIVEKQKQTIKQPQAETIDIDYVNLDAVPSSNIGTYYDSYAYFAISNAVGLENFSNCVRDGKTFQNKTVFLRNHIDWSTNKDGNGNVKNWQPIGAVVDGTKYTTHSVPFKGTFDGQGFTISNLKTDIDSDGLKGQRYVRIGLFAAIVGDMSLEYNGSIEMNGSGAYIEMDSCTVKPVKVLNVRVKNFTIENFDTNNWPGWHMSGLVAYAEGICVIENCVVENVTLNANKKAAKDYFGGIVCHYHHCNVSVGDTTMPLSYLVMKDCMVTNLDINPNSDAKESWFASVGPAHFVGATGNIPLGSTVDAANDALYKVFNALGWKYYAERFVSGQQMNNLYIYMLSNVNILSCENILLKGGEVSSYGVYNRDEISGFSYYDVYTWETESDTASTTFTTTNTTTRNDLRSNERWYIPPVKDFNNGCPYLRSFVKMNTYHFEAVNGYVDVSRISVPDSISITVPTTAEEFVVYGTTVTCRPADEEGYDFVNWTKSGTTYTANYKAKEFVVTFAKTSGDGASISPTVTQKTVSYKTQIKIEFNVSQNRIEAKQGNTVVAYWSLTGTNFKYYVDASCLQTYTIKANTTITPKVKFKTYGIGVA